MSDELPYSNLPPGVTERDISGPHDLPECEHGDEGAEERAAREILDYCGRPDDLWDVEKVAKIIRRHLA